MIKKIAIILLSILIFSCTTKKDDLRLIIGTWKISYDSNHYAEFKISKNYVIFLEAEEREIRISKSRFDNRYLLIKNQNQQPKIDTFELVHYSKDTLILNRKFLNQYYKYSKVENGITEIDSTDFKKWEEKTISDFIERVKIDLGNDFNFEIKIDTFDFEFPKRTELEIEIDSIVERGLYINPIQEDKD